MKSANLQGEGRDHGLGADNRSTETGEDYLACIFALMEDKGYARVADVAESLSVADRSKRFCYDQALSAKGIS
jgi:Iron dependent repressor, N-terminal DNA binding domain